MPYFTTRADHYIGDAEPPYHGMMPDITVSDHHPVDTGLLDHRGWRIMRAPERVGFHTPFKRNASSS